LPPDRGSHGGDPERRALHPRRRMSSDGRGGARPLHRAAPSRHLHVARRPRSARRAAGARGEARARARRRARVSAYDAEELGLFGGLRLPPQHVSRPGAFAAFVLLPLKPAASASPGSRHAVVPVHRLEGESLSWTGDASFVPHYLRWPRASGLACGSSGEIRSKDLAPRRIASSHRSRTSSSRRAVLEARDAAAKRA